MSERNGDRPSAGGLGAELPTERLIEEVESFLAAVVERGFGLISDKISNVTDKLTDYAETGGTSTGKALASGAKALGEGKSPLRAVTSAGLAGVKEKVSQAFRGRGGGGGKLKVTNIVEQIDVGVPRRVAYNQWTEFADFPSFMKKVEHVEQEEDEELTMKAQIFWSHRSWHATIIDQVPDQRIVWRSEGDKGHVDGAITFHALTPDLTRIVLVLEYHPQGLFEHTGNLWRAQGRRARLELKHFQRHVMTQTILRPDEVEGWRGEIRDGQVVREHGEEEDQYEDEYDEEPSVRDEGEEPEDQAEVADGEADYEDEAAEQPEDEQETEEEPAGEYEEEPADEEEYEEEPAAADEEEPAREVPRRRRRVTAESR